MELKGDHMIFRGNVRGGGGQASLTEYKGGSYRKLTANEGGDRKNVTEPHGRSRAFVLSQSNSSNLPKR